MLAAALCQTCSTSWGYVESATGSFCTAAVAKRESTCVVVVLCAWLLSSKSASTSVASVEAQWVGHIDACLDSCTLALQNSVPSSDILLAELGATRQGNMHIATMKNIIKRRKPTAVGGFACRPPR
jgi:hypothetical protein